jgi:3-oxoacyl-ACP reductase-like protein
LSNKSIFGLRAASQSLPFSKAKDFNVFFYSSSKAPRMLPVLASLAILLGDFFHILKIILIQPISALFQVFFSRNSTSYFQNKTVLITGASSGIGRAISLQLAKLGSNLILSSRSKEKLSEVQQECVQLNPACRVAIVPFDASAYRQADKLIIAAKAELVALGLPAQINVLINNAGVSARSSAMAASLSTTEQIMVHNEI